MKRILLTLLLALTCAAAYAWDFDIDDIYYTKIGSGKVSVTAICAKGSVTIPSKVTYSGTTYTVAEIKGMPNVVGESSEITSLFIPNTVTKIGDRAFEGCTSLKSVNIPTSITEIGNRVFYGCHGLTSITIPNSITKIGDYAFSCTDLKSIDLPNSVTSIGECAFSWCHYLTSFTIPNSVTYIGSWAFENCTKLASVTIGNSVTYIGSLVFERCYNLTSITIPNSVTYIGYQAFAYSGLTSAVFNAENCTYDDGMSSIFFECSSLKALTIGDAVKTIPNYIFAMSSIETVTIGNSVTTIGNNAFFMCDKLTSLTIPNSVTSIGVSAFYGCTGLTSLTIGSSVKTIGASAFYQCSSLKGALTIPNSVKTIGGGAFYDCSALTSLTIPNSVTEIVSGAFYGCSGLTSVVYNAENCTTMGDADGPVFEGCTNIASITIGKSVRLLVANAFKGCSKVSSVTSLNPTPPECDDVSVFRNIDMSSCKLYVPNAGYQSYKAADVWKKFSNIIVMDPVAVKTVTFSPSSLTLYVGDSSDITYTVKPADATVQALEWTVGDTKIASVKDNNDGTATVKALAAGETTITAKATDGSNVKSSCTVTVKKISGVDDVDAEGIAIVATADGIAVKGAPADSIIDVYAASGALVYHGCDSLIPIRSHGIYLVRVAGSVAKVAL